MAGCLYVYPGTDHSRTGHLKIHQDLAAENRRELSLIGGDRQDEQIHGKFARGLAVLRSRCGNREQLRAIAKREPSRNQPRTRSLLCCIHSSSIGQCTILKAVVCWLEAVNRRTSGRGRQGWLRKPSSLSIQQRGHRMGTGLGLWVSEEIMDRHYGVSPQEIRRWARRRTTPSHVKLNITKSSPSTSFAKSQAASVIDPFCT